MPDVNLLAVVMNGRNQPVLVPADVEDREFPDLVHRPEDPPEVGKRAEIGLGHDGIPNTERFLRLPVPGRELSQSLPCYDMHDVTVYLILRYYKTYAPMCGYLSKTPFRAFKSRCTIPASSANCLSDISGVLNRVNITSLPEPFGTTRMGT